MNGKIKPMWIVTRVLILCSFCRPVAPYGDYDRQYFIHQMAPAVWLSSHLLLSYPVKPGCSRRMIRVIVSHDMQFFPLLQTPLYVYIDFVRFLMMIYFDH